MVLCHCTIFQILPRTAFCTYLCASMAPLTLYTQCARRWSSMCTCRRLMIRQEPTCFTGDTERRASVGPLPRNAHFAIVVCIVQCTGRTIIVQLSPRRTVDTRVHSWRSCDFSTFTNQTVVDVVMVSWINSIVTQIRPCQTVRACRCACVRRVHPFAAHYACARTYMFSSICGIVINVLPFGTMYACLCPCI